MAELAVTKPFSTARQRPRWSSWIALLALLFAVFPASAAECARGAAACPMAHAARRCACCCPAPGAGTHLTPVPCLAAQATPAPAALLTRSEFRADRGAVVSHGALAASLQTALILAAVGSTTASDSSPPPAPPRPSAPSRAPPLSLR